MGKFKRSQKARSRDSFKEKRREVSEKLVGFAELVVRSGEAVIYPTITNSEVVPGLLGRLKAQYPEIGWDWHPECFTLVISQKTQKTPAERDFAGVLA